ncbi:MAG: hypothetical protein L0216_15885 [Planctomycetales bacterium]|nr:hypothetical protein [Planctomycetales bacterium]
MEPTSLFAALGLTGLFFAPPPGDVQEGFPPPQQPPPAAPMGPPPPLDDWGELPPRPLIVLGLAEYFATLRGHLEKENSSPAVGSGGNLLSHRTDLELQRWSHMPMIEAGLQPQETNFRLRAALQYGHAEGDSVLSRNRYNDGRLYLAGDTLSSKLTFGTADAEIHWLPRQERRSRGEFELFLGVRAYEFISVIEVAPTGRTPEPGRVSNTATGAFPRVGIAGWRAIGGGLMLFGNGSLGGWYSGNGDTFFAAGDADAQFGLGYVYRGKLDIRVGFRYFTLGTRREKHGDMNLVTIERSGFLASVRVVF